MKHSSAMIEALRSDGPRPELAAKLQLFGQFVGSWDVEIINYKPDGSREVVQGEWHFGWALEGRAIQDVWIAPKRSHREQAKGGTGDYGATLRFYDPKIDAWRSTWIGPVKGYVLPFIARQIGDEIVLEGNFESGKSRKWIFSDITHESFKWRAIESDDAWLTQEKVQEMSARRQTAEEPPSHETSNTVTLDKSQVATRLPVQDLERARSFYAEKLGLQPVEERSGGLLYRCGNCSFALFVSSGASSGDFTQVAFEVTDLKATVAALRARGVVFEEYDFPGLKTVEGIAEVEGNYPSKGGVGELASWFRDSEGNLLAIGQPLR